MLYAELTFMQWSTIGSPNCLGSSNSDGGYGGKYSIVHT